MSIRGSVSLNKKELPSLFSLKGFGGASEVKVEGKLKYYITFDLPLPFVHHGKIRLINKQRELVRDWGFRAEKFGLSISMPISEVMDLKFIKNIIGVEYLVCGEEKVRLVMSLEGSKRKFRFKNLTFTHYDDYSSIDFQCPEEFEQESILIAHLLFNRPHVDAEDYSYSPFDNELF